MKIAINKCYGGFGLSEAAYERLIELGVPVRAYIKEKPNKKGLYVPNTKNKGEVIFDNELVPPSERIGYCGRYWETWTRSDRTNPLVIQVIEELGDKASGPHAKLRVVEIPDDVDYEIDEYDGIEHIAERHATWG